MQAWLFTDSAEWASTAALLGVHSVRNFVTNSHGTPCLSSMYKYVANYTQAHCDDRQELGIQFDAYANCDLVFTKSLVDTLAEISRRWRGSLWTGECDGILVVGKRTNVELHSEALLNDDEVIRLSKRGTLFYPYAQDYFICSRNARDWRTDPRTTRGERMR